jgi:hypothetical protein
MRLQAAFAFLSRVTANAHFQSRGSILITECLSTTVEIATVEIATVETVIRFFWSF